MIGVDASGMTFGEANAHFSGLDLPDQPDQTAVAIYRGKVCIAIHYDASALTRSLEDVTRAADRFAEALGKLSPYFPATIEVAGKRRRRRLRGKLKQAVRAYRLPQPVFILEEES